MTVFNFLVCLVISGSGWVQVVSPSNPVLIYGDLVISTIHAVQTCALVLVGFHSMALAFSCIYFVYDLAACVIKRDFVFGMHAAVALYLIFSCVSGPWFELGMTKVLLTEFSTPFYNLWKKTKKEEHLGAFVLAFGLVRPFYLPYLVYTVREQPITISHFFFAVLCALNWVWFVKLLVMYYKIKKGKMKNNLVSPKDTIKEDAEA